eukprot:Rmarinus@m.7085
MSHSRLFVLCCVALAFIAPGDAAPLADSVELIADVLKQVMKSSLVELVDEITLNINSTEIQEALADMALPATTITGTVVNDMSLNADLVARNDTFIGVAIDGAAQSFFVGIDAPEQRVGCDISSAQQDIDIKMDVDELPLSASLESDQILMDIALNPVHSPIAVEIESETAEFGVEMETKIAVFDVTLNKVQIHFVTWMVLAILVAMQLASIVIMYFQSRRIYALQALATAYVMDEPTIFCSLCGAKNGATGKHCYACGSSRPWSTSNYGN